MNKMAEDTEQNRIYTHNKLCEKLHDTYKRKNHDYGNSFEQSLDNRGIVAALVRIEDKLNRLDALTKSDKQLVNDESLADTCLDAANYLIMTAMWLSKGTKESL